MKFVKHCGLAVLVLGLLAATAWAGSGLKSESGWFDFENCAFCKNLGAHPGLLEHSTWENFPISNGMVNIMSVQPEYADAMKEVEAAMTELGGQIMSGQVNPMTLPMCGHCQQYGMLMMTGQVKTEEVRAQTATITLMTAEDPGVIKQLQEMAERDTKEMALLMGGQ